MGGMALRLVDDHNPDPWERQPDEPTQQFGWFMVFRDMGSSRSIGRTSIIVGKTVDYLGRVSRSWDWVARATAWDDEQDRVWLGEVRDARRNAARRHAGLAERMLAIVSERLDQMAMGDRPLDPDQMVRWASAAVKIERLAIGAPSEIHDSRSTSVSVTATGGDADMTRRVIEDPVGRELAMQLLERMALEPGEGDVG